MKNAKRILSLLLVLVLMLTTVACGSKKPSLVGTWKAEIELKDMINKMMETELGMPVDVETSLIMPITLTFTEDGKASLTVDNQSIKDNMVGYLQSLGEILMEVIYQQGEAQGMSREEMDAALELQGLAKETLIDSLLAEIDVDELFDTSELSKNGVYKVADGKLWIEDTKEDFKDTDYATFELSGDTLTITALEGDSDDTEALEEFKEMGFGLFPLVFTRQGK